MMYSFRQNSLRAKKKTRPLPKIVLTHLDSVEITEEEVATADAARFASSSLTSGRSFKKTASKVKSASATAMRMTKSAKAPTSSKSKQLHSDEPPTSVIAKHTTKPPAGPVAKTQTAPPVLKKQMTTPSKTHVPAAAAAPSRASRASGPSAGRKPLTRINSSPAVIPRKAAPPPATKEAASSSPISSSQLAASPGKETLPSMQSRTGSRTSKTVRIDDDVQICPVPSDFPSVTWLCTRPRCFGNRLVRRKSFESLGEEKTARQKSLQSFFPRRRFSQSAIDPIRDLLEEVEEADRFERRARAGRAASAERDEQCDFAALSREEQLQVLQSRSHESDQSETSADCRDWVGLRSLTGLNASGWKFQDSYYGNFNIGRRPSMDTAWGRRVYDQYEMEISVDKPKNKYLGNTEDKQQPRELGLWDLMFSPDIIPKLKGAQRWDPQHEEKAREIRKHKIDVSKIYHDVVITDELDDPVNQFKMKFMQTGDYLRPHDMRYCIEKTNFTEDHIIDWFKRFKRDCPDGRLTRDGLRSLFRQAFPEGDAEKFSRHIMRIFDSDGNDFLDFKEFLMAIDIATCETEESKLKWAFKLYDADNTGCIELKDMVAIMETLESLEGVKKEDVRVTYDESGNPEPVPSASERAKDLFDALDKNRDGFLTLDEFVKGYMERNELLARADATEQKRKLDCLILKGPAVPEGVPDDKWFFAVSSLVEKRTGVPCESEDLDFVCIRAATEEVPKSVFVRFKEREMRMRVWNTRPFAKKNGLIMEEWLTATRTKIWLKCKELKVQGLIKDVLTKNGDVYAIVAKRDSPSGGPPTPGASTSTAATSCSAVFDTEKILVVTDTQFENLLKMTKGVDDKSCQLQVISVYLLEEKEHENDCYEETLGCAE